MNPKIVYFVHDLSDGSVHRRVRTLSLGGATVTVIGFRRSLETAEVPYAAEVIDLGRTRDAKLIERSMDVVRSLVFLDRFADSIRGADLVMARNLEMLVLASKARRRHARGAKLIFECLDIHSMLLSDRLAGRLLRTLESRLWRDVDLLLTSSPVFIENYFQPRGFTAPIQVVENKVLVEHAPTAHQSAAPIGPPWRIGWFGLLRCQRSLDSLGAIAKALDGAVEIVLRGRPSSAIFPDFPAAIAHHPHMRFEGPYRYPDDLARIYGEVHFSWAIDYYEEGQNSSWLLPNRLYESGLHDVVPIALRSVATGRWLADRGIGVVLEEPVADRLIAMFRQLDAKTYGDMASAIAARPASDYSLTPAGCREFVEGLMA